MRNLPSLESGKINHVRCVTGRENLITSGRTNEPTHTLWSDYTWWNVNSLCQKNRTRQHYIKLPSSTESYGECTQICTFENQNHANLLSKPGRILCVHGLEMAPDTTKMPETIITMLCCAGKSRQPNLCAMCRLIFKLGESQQKAGVGLSEVKDAREPHLVCILTVGLHKMATQKFSNFKSSWIAQLLLTYFL